MTDSSPSAASSDSPLLHFPHAEVLQVPFSTVLAIVSGAVLLHVAARSLFGWYFDRTKTIAAEESSTATDPTPAAWAKAELKQVFVVRNDLGMGKGKIAAQCGHATLSAYQKMMKVGMNKLARSWAHQGQKKIALKIPDEDSLLALCTEAKKAGLIVAKIHDAGHTQVDAGSLTVAAIGPGPEKAIDKVTGHLKLL